MRKVALGGLALLLLAGAGTVCRVGWRSHYECIECGFYFRDRTFFGIAFPIHERRLRTAWYDRRIDKPHDHRWSKSSCTAGLNLWGSPIGFWCGDQESLVGSDRWVSQVLARLEPLELDLPYHSELTQADVDHRNASMAAIQDFDPNWKDAEVLWWWERTCTDLADK